MRIARFFSRGDGCSATLASDIYKDRCCLPGRSGSSWKGVRMNRGFLVALSVALVTAAACNNNNTDTTTGPSPAKPSITEMFSGTVPIGGSHFHNFTVTQSGEVTITLNSAGP